MSNLVSGKERRELKKKLSALKSCVKHFHYIEDIERIYGGGMSDEDGEKLLNKKRKEIAEIEDALSVQI